VERLAAGTGVNVRRTGALESGEAEERLIRVGPEDTQSDARSVLDGGLDAPSVTAQSQPAEAERDCACDGAAALGPAEGDGLRASPLGIGSAAAAADGQERSGDPRQSSLHCATSPREVTRCRAGQRRGRRPPKVATQSRWLETATNHAPA
jgi:hypothetical protein